MKTVIVIEHTGTPDELFEQLVQTVHEGSNTWLKDNVPDLKVISWFDGGQPIDPEKSIDDQEDKSWVDNAIDDLNSYRGDV